MWISKQAAQGGTEAANPIETGVITIGGEKAAVVTAGESRSVTMALPGGYFWLPSTGDNVLSLSSADGERFISAVVGERNDVKMQSGEVYITSKAGAAILLKNDGRVHIYGDAVFDDDLKVEGNLQVSGRLSALSITSSGNIYYGGSLISTAE